MKVYSKEEKEALVEQFKKMLDNGDDIGIYETVEIPEIVIDPFLEGKCWPEPYKRKVHQIIIKSYERE